MGPPYAQRTARILTYLLTCLASRPNHTWFVIPLASDTCASSFWSRCVGSTSVRLLPPSPKSREVGNGELQRV
ncbi:uncharacterized protein GGS25DRAFT_496155 [Hypoxylon fragiforme]|uniref:uncharacterized protein n=1 Tax=Hypoxylon fragiforme TaxID=63214 RepID=UPI0020C5E908|nr:uncharacterized protein GGS25DRAFT_496155 [Hypoxylon fragiforme]KAI2607501.1 hypothetical protein GGS25DRAFT_496155 [Hypoxylon fragiforme]